MSTATVESMEDLILYSNWEKHWFSISELQHEKSEFETNYQVQG